MKYKITGIILFITSIVFQRMQTNHFGNNFLPQSFLEFMCDLFSILIIAFAFVLFNKENSSVGSKKITLYIATIIYSPITIFKLFISAILVVDIWCDKIVSKILDEIYE